MQIGEPTNPKEAHQDHWIAIKLVDFDGYAQAREAYVVQTPGGDTISGQLDNKGYCRIYGIKKGSYRICFPDLQALDYTIER